MYRPWLLRFYHGSANACTIVQQMAQYVRTLRLTVRFSNEFSISQELNEYMNSAFYIILINT